MLTIDLVGDREIVAQLDVMPGALRGGLARTMTQLSIELTLVIARKLSGQVLHVRSGALLSSLRGDMTNTETEITARIYTNSPYAAIHEYGGTIHVPEITPKTARALAFEVGGQTIFRMLARAHTVHMPERSFMRSALKETTPRIREELNRTFSEVMRWG